MPSAKPILFQLAAALLLMAGLVILPHRAVAAPFCVAVEGVPPSCLYEDIDECKRDASRQNGWCSANIKEIGQLPLGGGRVCLIETSRVVRCLYVDMRSCQLEANRSEGVCFERPYSPPPRREPR